jgi:hypothetical protein
MLKEIFLIYCYLIIFVFNQIANTFKYKEMDGMQIYFGNNDNYYFYSTLTGNSSQIIIEMNLYLDLSLEEVNSTSSGNKGVWAGIGFGNNNMFKTEAVLFQYFPDGRLVCNDAWLPGHYLKFDTELGGKNDVTYITGSIKSLESSFAPYKTLISWKCSKNISSLDEYDWQQFSTWQTNNAPVIGAWSINSSDEKPLPHGFAPKTTLTLVDGSGVTSS